MTQPTSRTTFKDYCKRKLGHPVVELNLDDDQIEDAIDDAVQYFQEYHYDGTHPEFVKKLLADPAMMVYFTRELDRVSAPEYLAEIKDVLGEKSADSLDSLQAEFPAIGTVWEVVSARQKVLRKVINPSIASIAYATPEDVLPGRASILLNVANPLAVPIEVLGIM